MSRNALLSIAVTLVAMTAAAVSAEAERPVKHGAMDICQAIDDGSTVVEDGIEACCAQEVTPDGPGEKYCVACVEGTDDCTFYDNERQVDMKQVNKVLMQMQKQAPLTGN
jgi:hypothetical protein